MARFEINPLIEHMLSVHEDISDLNFSVGKAPQVEINGILKDVPIKGLDKLLPFHTEVIAMHLLGGDEDKTHTLLKNGSIDLSYSIPRKTRFRVNVFSQRGTYSIVLRVIPSGVPSIDDLSLPAIIKKVPDERNGIVLVTGPTGSGKSTTLAAIINHINERSAYHIVTIEDPIEYLHTHKKATVNQRELGADTPSFSLALRAALRQAPKVILVGEMRDLETTEIALEAAETGHLVLSTLHTIDASKTIDRIIGIFPKHEEAQIRTRLAQTFKWIISQRLMPRADDQGRIAALEILKSTMRTRDYIIKGEKEGGRSLIDAMSDGEIDGMQPFDKVLAKFYEKNKITRETALSFATNANNLALVLEGTARMGA